MPQVKFYGRRDVWSERTREISDVVHSCLVDAWRLPPDKRFQRFLWLEAAELVAPLRSERYLIVELLCFEGRDRAAKAALIELLFERARQVLGLEPADLEITIVETPRADWGIRGRLGDELELDYPTSP